MKKLVLMFLVGLFVAPQAYALKRECIISHNSYGAIEMSGVTLGVGSTIKLNLDYTNAQVEIKSEDRRKVDLSQAITTNNPSPANGISSQIYIGLPINNNLLRYEIRINNFSAQQMQAIPEGLARKYQVTGNLLFSQNSENQVELAKLACTL